MKRQFILLLVFALLAVGLGGLLWFLNNSAAEPPQESSSITQTGVDLLQKQEGDLTSVEVTNQAGGFTVSFDGKTIRVSDLDETIPLAESKLESMRSGMLSVHAEQKIEQVSSLSDFGLEQPRAVVTASYRDDSTYVLEIGADAPGGQGVYCKTDDDSVYVFAEQTVSNFLGSLVDLVDTAVTQPPKTESGEAAKIKQVTFTGQADAEPITIERKADEEDAALETFRLVTPGHGSVDSEKEQVLSALLNIRADQAAALNPADEQLESFGLKEPCAAVEFKYEENGTQQRCVLYAGKSEGATVYLMREGRPVVYAIASDRLPWLTMDYGDFVSKRAPMPNIQELQSVTVTVPEQAITFEISGEDDSLLVTSGGKTVDTARFKSYYQSLIGVSADEYTDTPPASDTPLLTVTYTYRDSAKQADTVCYYEGPTRRAIMQINGGDRFLMREKHVDILLKNTQSIQNDGEIEPTI